MLHFYQLFRTGKFVTGETKTYPVFKKTTIPGSAKFNDGILWWCELLFLTLSLI